MDVSIDLDAVSSKSANPACPRCVPASGQSLPGMIHSMSSATSASRASLSPRPIAAKKSFTVWMFFSVLMASSPFSSGRIARDPIACDVSLLVAGLSHVEISVVSTGARSAERRDLLSTISGFLWREGLSARAFGSRSRRREQPYAKALLLVGCRVHQSNLTRSLKISRPQLFPRACTSSPPSSDLRHAAIDGQIHAGDVGTFIGGEERDGSRDFLRLAPATHRDL